MIFELCLWINFCISICNEDKKRHLYLQQLCSDAAEGLSVQSNTFWINYQRIRDILKIMGKKWIENSSNMMNIIKNF